MLKIGMVTSCYHPVVNGVVRMIELYREQLERLGHHVTIFSFGPQSSQDDECIVRLGGIPLGKTGYHWRPNFPSRAIQQLNQMDVIHCHHLFLGPEMLPGRVTPPVVYTNHTRYNLYTENYLPIPIPAVRKWAADKAIRRVWPNNTGECAAVIAPSEHVADVMQEFGVTAPIEVIHNGIDLSSFKPTHQTSKHSKKMGIFVGRLSPEKEIPNLIKGMIAVCQRSTNVQFKLVGDGPLRAQSQQQIEAAGMADQIDLHGWAARSDIPQLLARADFQVTMSVSEVHPLAIIEGMAAGLPGVVLAEGAMVECVGDSAIKADGRDAWVDGVLKLANSAELRANLGRAAITQASKYDIAQTIKKTVTLYTKVIHTEAD
ncbi:MAG: glycosyltransferase [Chloroflexota bacterium]